nr:hypothetical protein [Nitrososphaeria archaeon]NIN53387.1 hypothetical protein [Nitrososphaeria archaeon]NIQ33899.1 hypothetical protein [Nitrososphaeria archaeon]
MSTDVSIPYIVMNRLSDLRKTRQLFHEDPYMRSFESKVLEAVEANGNVFVVLEETCFHPQGGGQPADTGHIEGENSKLEVLDTQSIGGVIIHISRMKLGEIRVDDLLRGEISWDTRYTYMKQHTASHIVFSAVQRILKIDDLQYMGFELGKEKARMDINYGKPISPEELRGIETFSNTICLESRPVKSWQTTREEAEGTYGDRLGLTDVTPAGKVRVVEVQDWDTSLCSGTHVGSTSECTPIRILGRFRLQKGVERLEFTSGKAAFQYIERDLETLNQLGRLLSIPVEKLSERVKRLVEDT